MEGFKLSGKIKKKLQEQPEASRPTELASYK